MVSHLALTSPLPAAGTADDGLRLPTSAELFAWFVDRPLKILVVVVGALLLRWLAHRLIDRLVARLTADRRPSPDRVDTTELPVLRRQARMIGRSFTETTFATPERQAARIATLGSVLRSVSSVLVGAVATLMVLSELGLDVAPLLASAGVAGVALGFGAQSLVKDYLSGMFMIVEDQYGVGDVVDTGEVTGTVVDVSLRVTTIRDFNGVVWYVRNGEIVRVANRSQGWSTALVDVPVAASQDMARVLRTVARAVAGMEEDPAWQDRLIDPVEVGGVESIVGHVATVRLIAKCAPNESVPVGREVRERVLSALAAEGITPPPSLPFTQP